MAKKFTSASLSDEELADLDPWLQDNLGELDEGSFWIIERNEKTGKVEAVMMDENFTSKSRKTIPDEAISTPLSKEEEESFDKEMPAYRRASRPVRQEGETTAQEVDEVEAERRGDKSGRFGRKQKDFSRPSSVEESRAKSRGQTFTPPPVRKPKFAEPKEEGYKPRFADAKEQPQRKPPKMEEPSARTPRFAAPKVDAYKPRFADPVEEEPEAELEPIIDPKVKKPRIKKPSRTAPIVEAEAPAVEETPVAEPAKKASERAGFGVEEKVGEETPTEEEAPTEEVDELPSEVDMAEAGKSKGRTSSRDRYTVVKEAGAGPESEGGGVGGKAFTARGSNAQGSYDAMQKKEEGGFGLGKFAKAIGGGIKGLIPGGDDTPDYIKNPPQENVAITMKMPKGMSRRRAEFEAKTAARDHFINTYHSDDIITKKNADGSTTTGFKGRMEGLGSYSMSFYMDEKNGLIHLNYNPNKLIWTADDNLRGLDDEEKKRPRLR